MGTQQRLGDMLVSAGLISADELKKALRLQAGGTRRIGYLLIRMGFITEEQLQATLAEQLGIPLVRCSERFSPEVRKLLPRYLCTRFNVLPLALGQDNILEIAMVDPSDTEAISEIEKYTGKVLRPLLASQSDIFASIRSHIPWSSRDIFNAGNSTWITMAIGGLALALVAITILQYNHDKFRSKYGITTRTANAIIYQNHDLILKFNRSGTISLQGHGAYASGSYAIIFNDINSLKKFLDRKKTEFSSGQLTWLNWALQHGRPPR
ncbi:MAG TPA: hypothetical protein ENI89_01810 [Desulfobulbus sp.]|nr:hypothetical protein [Desulfobulbus sp.]